MTIKAKKSKINLREKLAELLNFRQIRDRLDGLGLYLGKDRTGTAENVAVRGGANIDDLQLAEISAALGDTAVDVFVYDTRNDSDGGKWRERTQHTSWYNEELNTATRGGRREFPAVAVIVAESNKVTIYDGDDPDLSMWMVFNASGGRMIWATQLSCVSSLNARLSIGSPASGFRYIDFVSDKMREWRTSGVNSISGDISERNSGNLTLIDIPGQDVIVNQIINDVAMTVLPNAPIDSETGLPIPTIAVATDGGVSVIKDDGSTVVDISGGVMKKVSFDSNNQLHLGRKDSNIYYYAAIPSGDIAEGTWRAQSDVLYVGNIVSGADIQIGDNDIVDVVPGVIGLDDDEDNSLVRLDINKNSLSDSMINFTNSRYNTGWMPGDIKLATLSDTTVETIGVNSDELLKNADFVDTNSDGADDWILRNSATTSTSGTAVTITNGSADAGYIFQVVNTEIGKQYLFSVDVDHVSNNGRVFLGKTGANVSSSSYLHEQNINSDKTIEYYFTAETENLYVRIGLQNSTVGNSISFDNISVRATTELITNGDFSAGDDGSWTKGAGWTISGEVASISSSTAESHITQEVYVEAGKVYAFKTELINHTNGTFGISWFTGTATLTAVNDVTTSRTSNGQLLRYVKASSSGTVNLSIYTGTSGTGSVDNVSFREVELDRSVNNNGLQVFGEIEKTPVAPGADLVAYSGFSANDYLMQPYNGDLDFGTGDFSIMGWVKLNSSSSNRRILQRADEQILGSRFELTSLSGGQIQFGVNDASTLESIISSSFIDNNVWTFISCKNEGSTLYLYINGVRNAEPITHSVLNLNNSSALLSLGVSVNQNNSLAGGSMALFRISATVPTDAQIAKIYRDEKVLFQDGAQATLYGTSDAVTALAYDDKTELLHVGTSDGRSDFAGLRRINNTTTAVTTSISASNNLIAEQ